MLWAASTWDVFGFLEAFEFTVFSLSEFNPLLHLTVAANAIDSIQSATTCLCDTSKTDPFHTGYHIYIGRDNTTLLEQSGSSPGLS